MPSTRPRAPRPSARLALTLTGAPAHLGAGPPWGGVLGQPGPLTHNRDIGVHDLMPAASSIARTRSAAHGVDTGPACRRCRGNDSRDRPGRPRPTGRRRRRGRRRRHRCAPPSPGLRVCLRRRGQATRAGDCRESVHVEALAHPKARGGHRRRHDGARAHASTTARSSACRHLDVAGFSGHDAHGSARRLDQGGVVGGFGLAGDGPGATSRARNAWGVWTATSPWRSTVSTTAVRRRHA